MVSKALVINSFLFIFTHNITNTTSTQTNKTKQQTHTQYFKSPVKRNRERERKIKTKQVIPEDSTIQSRILNMSLVSGHRKQIHGANIPTHGPVQWQSLNHPHSVTKYLEYALNIHKPKIVFNKWRKAKALPFYKWHVNVSVRSRYQNT